uniref:FER tyrosine kinase n=1 Tax=Chrysemys picta bellii TaxID=8478 RepID=A0A8C3HLS8_CHRPI
MGFGSDLKYSHDALLKLQDWELRLLETVKKFMAMRVKSDKEYASTLQNLCNQVDKESTSQLDYISNVSKSWLLMVQQTEQLSRIMKTHAEDLNSGPLHRLTMMIKDKQQVKKSYIGVHQQIEAEMFKAFLGSGLEKSTNLRQVKAFLDECCKFLRNLSLCLKKILPFSSHNGFWGRLQMYLIPRIQRQK